MNQKLTDFMALVAAIDPDAYAAGTVITDEIDMAVWEKVIFVVMAGTLGTSATVDFSVKGGASSNAGSHSTAVTGKAITQLTDAGSDDDKQAIVEVSHQECGAQGLRYIEGSLVVAVATSDAGAVAFGVPRNYGPAHKLDLASVDEIVS